MGSVISSDANTVPEEVAKKVKELGVLFCNAGDGEVGRVLQHISNSPDQLCSLRTAILQEARASSHGGSEEPREAVEAEKSTEELWLDNFVPKKR
ncbi:hypothetical protein B7463_g10498, partial [Scytalidium lignicola]